MNISKLTITPIMSEASSIVIKNPTSERAAFLMKERLVSGSYESQLLAQRQELKHKKLPTWLKNFVNPETWVKTIGK